MNDAPSKITPCLWFDFNAEEAVDFYRSVFPASRVLETSYYNDAVPDRKGKVLTMRFELAGQQFLALNGGPQFPFTEAISLAVDCTAQEEIDTLWQRLSEGGSTGQCGWLRDRFGLSWQLVPREMIAMLRDPDPARATRVMQAMMGMQKLDLAVLRRAYEH